MSAKFHWLHWAGLDRSSSSEAESSVLGVQNRKMFLHAKAKEIKQKLVVVDRQVAYVMNENVSKLDRWGVFYVYTTKEENKKHWQHLHWHLN